MNSNSNSGAKNLLRKKREQTMKALPKPVQKMAQQAVERLDKTASSTKQANARAQFEKTREQREAAEKFKMRAEAAQEKREEKKRAGERAAHDFQKRASDKA